jgi:hypothetical protein
MSLPPLPPPPRGASLTCESLEVRGLFSCSTSSSSIASSASVPLLSTSSSNGLRSANPGSGVSTCAWFRHWRRSAALEDESDEARRGLERGRWRGRWRGVEGSVLLLMFELEGGLRSVLRGRAGWQCDKLELSVAARVSDGNYLDDRLGNRSITVFSILLGKWSLELHESVYAIYRERSLLRRRETVCCGVETHLGVAPN